MRSRFSICDPTLPAREAAGRRPVSGPWRLLLLAAILPATSGCGFGTIGAALGLSSGGSGSGSGGGLPTTLTGFSLEGTQAPPATIRFQLFDPESQTAMVELRMLVPDGSGGETDSLLTQLTQNGVPSPNPLLLEASPTGTEHVFQWDFPDEPGLPSDGTLVEGVTVFALVPGVVDEAFNGTNAEISGLGNNPPAVTDLVLPQEAGGVVGIPFEVVDTTGDLVRVRIEFDVQGDDPDAGFLPVTPQFASAPPEFAVLDIEASEDGTPFTFAWDTSADLGGSELDVVLRLTPDDGLVEGPALVSDVLRVDNSSVPTALIDGGGLLASTDNRRGIGIPYSVSDGESDRVRVAFQWRSPSGSFPDLPTSADELEQLLADPVQREQAQIATPFPLEASGPMEALDATTVRLGGITRQAPWLVTQGLEGQGLVLRRGRIEPADVTSSFSTTTLDGPVGVLPGSMPDRFLILDSGPLGWRLRDLEVSGGEGPTLASGPGMPTAMAMEASGESILLATVQAGDWAIERVFLGDGTIQPLLSRSEPLPSGPVRGIAARGPNGAVITVDDALLSLDLRPGAPGVGRVVSAGLSQPTGVVLLPGSVDRVLVAETFFDPGTGSTGRLLAIDLRRALREEYPLFLVNSPGLGTPDLLRPRALAFDETGSRLLVTGERASDLQIGVFEFSVGAQGRATGSLLTAFGAEASAVSYGPFGARWVTLAGLNQILVGSGARAQFQIESFDSGTEVATLTEPLTTFPQVGDQWAATNDDQPFVQATPGGRDATFVWDSGADIEAGGSALFRATPYDMDAGLSSQTTGAILVRDDYEVAPLVFPALDSTPTLQAPALAFGDLDLDGDSDLVGLFFGGSDQVLEAFLQDPPREFGERAPFPDDPELISVVDLELADVDLDGDLDIVTANSLGTFTIVRQAADGTLGLDPSDVLGDSDTNPNPFGVEAADFDADGIPELLGSHNLGTDLFVSGAGGPGVFAATRTFDATLAVPRAVDINRDGLTDVLLPATLGLGAQAFFATSAGVFEDDPVQVSAMTGYVARDLLAADFGFGGPDLIHDESSARLTYSPTESDGGFAPNQDLPIPTGIGVFQPGELAAADLDRDGNADLIVADGGSPQAGLLRTNGIQTFASPTVIGPFESTTPVATSAGAIAARDSDGDGRADLALGAGGAWNHHHPVRPGEFTSSDTEELAAGDAPRQVFSGDLDGDGDLDLVLGNSDGTPGLRVQRAPTQFDVSFLIPTSPPVTADRVALVDLDGDGDLDILHASGTRLALRYQEGLGDGPAGPASFPASSAVVIEDPRFSFGVEEGTNLVASDLDANGELDLVFASPAGDSIFILSQNGGVFDVAAAQELADPSLLLDPRQIAVFDFNLDGRSDLVVADLATDSLVFFTNTAAGFNTTDAFSLASPSANLLELCDLDGDGRIDLITNDSSASSVRVRFQALNGSFGDVTTIAIPQAPSGTFTRAIRCVDVDSDGLLDLVVKINQRVIVLRQGASRSFQEAAPGLLPVGAPNTNLPSEALEAVDLDGDGDTDLIAGSLNGVALGVLYGAH